MCQGNYIMGQSVSLANEQARRFLLLKQGLLGDYKYSDKQGVLDYIRLTEIPSGRHPSRCVAELVAKG